MTTYETAVSRALNNMICDPESLDYIEVSGDNILGILDREIIDAIVGDDTYVTFKINSELYLKQHSDIKNHLEDLNFMYVSESIASVFRNGYCDTLDSNKEGDENIFIIVFQNSKN